MRVIVIGAGSMGLRHIRNLRALGHEVLVVETAPRALAAAQRAGAAYWDAEPMPDAEVIATPADFRPLQAVRFAFVEKPLATTIEHARWAYQPDTIQVGYNLRFDPDLGAFRQRVHADDLGKPLSARVVFGQALASWRPELDVGSVPYARTGILLEASHELDLIRYVFGEPEVLASYVGWRLYDIRGEDTALALLSVQGMPIELHLDMTYPGYMRRMEFIGSRRTVDWQIDPQRVEVTYLEEIRAFCRWVETGERDKRAATFEDGIRALELVERIRAAA